ncbi:uncharacterized protein LOC143281514 isoform X2 [Babylonia areolata]
MGKSQPPCAEDGGDDKEGLSVGGGGGEGGDAVVAVVEEGKDRSGEPRKPADTDAAAAAAPAPATECGSDGSASVVAENLRCWAIPEHGASSVQHAASADSGFCSNNRSIDDHREVSSHDASNGHHVAADPGTGRVSRDVLTHLRESGTRTSLEQSNGNDMDIVTEGPARQQQTCLVKNPPFPPEKRHVCDACGQFFVDGVQLQAHLVVHPAVYMFPALRCGGCGACFNVVRDLAGHCEVMRRKQGTRCHRCRQWFPTCEDLYRHQQQRQYRQEGKGSLLLESFGFVLAKRDSRQFLRRV